ncbi:MAG: UDP-N-acetylenolpyruvoylglucosamine reductase, partial [Micrococcales bacterium]
MTTNPTRLADLTTLRVGGPASRVAIVEDTDALVAAVQQADCAGEPVLVVGGGSNLLAGDTGFDGTVVVVRTRGVRVADVSACGGATVWVAAGEPWDEFVVQAVAQGWAGIEALSGIPGLVGATPMQNVGAYGQEVAQTIASVRTYDRVDRQLRTFAAAECGFGYRSSRFKTQPGRYLILEVGFQFRLGDLGAPVAYAELARTLGVEPGQRAPMTEVRAVVLQLRRGKGMVLDVADHDTWSAGSFFTNPVVPSDAALPQEAPRYPAGTGRIKSSAAWLIEQAGFPKGYGLPGPAALSTKHSLAVTNRGTATAEDVLALAREVQGGVKD